MSELFIVCGIVPIPRVEKGERKPSSRLPFMVTAENPGGSVETCSFPRLRSLSPAEEGQSLLWWAVQRR